MVYDHRGEPIEGAEIVLEWEEHQDGLIQATTTDANGSFSYEYIKPGLARIDMQLSEEITDTLVEQLFLSPPALIEPYGFTSGFNVPSPNDFADEPCPFEQNLVQSGSSTATRTKRKSTYGSKCCRHLHYIGYGFMDSIIA